MSNQDAFDATQRVYLDEDGHPTTPPTPPQKPRPPRPTPAQRAAQKRRQQRITLIALCSAAVVLVILLTVVIINALNPSTEDDGKIVPNVTVAGVSIGGMTPEEAKTALQPLYQDYATTDMVVTLNMGEAEDLDGASAGTTLVLTPENTGAKLDVDALVQAVYQLGRTGSRSQQQQDRTNSHSIDLAPYLYLDTDYIKSEIDALGAQYSTLLKESYCDPLSGTRPSMTQEVYDTATAYQTLTIHIGTAYYELKTEELYNDVINSYHTVIFQLSKTCTVQRPEKLDYLEIYQYAGCTEPVDAVWNDDRKEIESDAVYGYGFTLEELQAALEGAAYGDVITVDLHFIAPNITSDYYLKQYFQDILSYHATPMSENDAWNTNLQLVCDILNNHIIDTDEEFSFNAVIGEPTLRQGFKAVDIYLGKSYQQVIGGGISQAASMLYYCALKADLDILERSSHSYVESFFLEGFDAQVYHDSMDLRFRNTTGAPIRILAEIKNGSLHITFEGTDSRSYTVELTTKTDETFLPDTVVNVMSETNPNGYTNGDVLRPGITGYLISTYITRYDKETGNKIGSRTLIAQTYYAKQDEVIVEIYTPPVVEPDPPVVPDDPDTPDNPDNPDDPDNPDTPVDPDDPDNPDTPVDPDDPDTPADPNAPTE